MVDEKEVLRGGFHTKWSPSKKNDSYSSWKNSESNLPSTETSYLKNPKKFLKLIPFTRLYLTLVRSKKSYTHSPGNVHAELSPFTASHRISRRRTCFQRN